MKEKREIVSQVADLLEYKIRSGAISNENGDKIWRIALKQPEKVDAIMKILDLELDDDETLTKIERLP